jgi:hypothetical protein
MSFDFLGSRQGARVVAGSANEGRFAQRFVARSFENGVAAKMPYRAMHLSSASERQLPEMLN